MNDNQQSGDKTEHPTPQKLRRARQSGQVVRSRELATALGIFAALQMLALLLPGWLADFRRLFAFSLADLSSDGALENAWSILFPAVLLLLAKMLSPLAAVPLCIIVGSLFPGGWIFSAQHFAPKFSRLNPLNNLKQMISPKHLIQVGLSILKALMLSIALWQICRATLSDFIQLQSMPLEDALQNGTHLLWVAALTLFAVLSVFPIIDLPAQRFLFLRGQRMTKHDLKEEHKRSEGRPEVRSRIRQLQRQIAQRSIRKTVPTADVVIANPSHYSVALKYDESRADAPFVVAKGIDETALFIREVAKQHGIEVIILPLLARAIYNTSQINQQIPAPLYRAVAQVLIYVMQIKAFRSGQRQAQPQPPTAFEIPEAFLETRPS